MAIIITEAVDPNKEYSTQPFKIGPKTVDLYVWAPLILCLLLTLSITVYN